MTSTTETGSRDARETSCKAAGREGLIRIARSAATILQSAREIEGELADLGAAADAERPDLVGVPICDEVARADGISPRGELGDDEIDNSIYQLSKLRTLVRCAGLRLDDDRPSEAGYLLELAALVDNPEGVLAHPTFDMLRAHCRILVESLACGCGDRPSREREQILDSIRKTVTWLETAIA